MSDAFVHATAVIDAGATLGSDTKIWHFCHVSSGARIGTSCVLGQNVYVAGTVVIGDGCRIQNNVSVYDGVTLGNGVFVGPSAVFTNVGRPRAAFPRRDAFEPTTVEDGATVGANATIRCGVRIGRGAFVGAGAVVLNDVPPFTVVAGVPARAIGVACLCGESVSSDALVCTGCGRTYAREGDGYTATERSS